MVIESTQDPTTRKKNTRSISSRLDQIGKVNKEFILLHGDRNNAGRDARGFLAPLPLPPLFQSNYKELK